MSPILGIWASQISGHLWAPTGAYDALATITVPSGGVASVTFSGIPSGYKHLQIRAIAKNTYTASANYDNLTLQFNGDTSSSSYARHGVYGNGSSPFAYGVTSQTFVPAGIIPRSHSSQANMFGAAVCDILDYTSTSKYKVTRSLSGTDYNGGGAVGLYSGLWLSTAAITSITLATDLNNLAEFSQFALFGVK